MGSFIFYSKQISQLTNLNYSKEASRKILFSKNKDYVLSVGENKTLNAAFESEDYNEKYLDNYSKINYVNHKDLIKNINNLLKVGYSNSDINLIITHGSNEDVIEFAKRDKVRYLEEFYTLDYAKIKNYDRYVALSDETGDNEDDIVIKVNLDLDKENYVECTQVVDFSTDMLVNKHRCLNKDFVPDDLVDISSKYTDEKDLKISRIAMNAFIKMYEAAEKEGYQLVINSAYRSYEEQEELVNTYLNSYGQAYVDKYVAKPGHLLMIDEPELNLHPESQRKLARLLALLVKLGVNVYITTHSDYIIKEFNTLLMLHTRRDNEKIQAIMIDKGYIEQELLSPKQIKMFISDKQYILLPGNTRKTKIQSLIPAYIDPRFGIEAVSFDDTIRDMNSIQELIMFT